MIKIKGLSKSFGDKKILDNVNVSIAENSILTLVGPSGGGKTTLLRCLAGLETADSGEVWMNDSVLKFSEIAGDIGFVFQDFNLFPHFTVLENITLAPKMTKKKDKKQIDEEALKLLEKFGLKEQVNQYPSQLSGGQKQRVAIVRALIMSPKLLCYDEPTSALDPLLVDSIAETIMELKEEGMTQVVVTHDLSFAKKISDTLIEVNPV
ncbi:amino acid ABC transporter ATP-binding protein [Vagococcus fluvialis]|jgi:polar amino acid transport system ATP-binding protein|uniref:Polar amino acid ABC transporter ATP-binding protein n=1 Tax=Vagococcus fluvialis TaxID=2738 RepID=A0A369ASM4_9ENTE|nr:amino acid ABC transporter ATP-binding protein [Vagococcus fluvialis]MDR2277963.1 amino acid ABC transporter ATP-binding protein [Vagococcus sp.]MBO0478598.1 amino acid ABC transporter ATP-binding protein [Vagococcus fluvialis]MBO0485416.1 amino acid ABC transporter ATP-binding protein [Vagococcus fluvialis]MDT2745457.1 amino acid ABC transporter ATP-binding protein [Vagococcus fluvialis]MDT2782320.1 amino acid ABC transporter ATP-binding protein [Vagococcus fluvialis]